MTQPLCSLHTLEQVQATAVPEEVLPVCLASGLCARGQRICMPQAVFMLIGKTSALTMNIAGVIKDWLLIFLSFYLFRAPVTAMNLLGYAFCCTGVCTCAAVHARQTGFVLLVVSCAIRSRQPLFPW